MPLHADDVAVAALRSGAIQKPLAPPTPMCQSVAMGLSDNIKNTTAAAITAAGMITGGTTPPPSTNQLSDAQQIAQRRTEPARGDVTKNPTTSSKP
jgi:hypothetical protein